MKNFNVKFLREFEVQIQADTAATAQVLANRVLAQFPVGSCRLLSIIAENYVEPAKADEPGVELSKEARAIVERNAGLADSVRRLTDDQPEVA